jgi:O-antigen/teichoic acid export membrane protein
LKIEIRRRDRKLLNYSNTNGRLFNIGKNDMNQERNQDFDNLTKQIAKGGGVTFIGRIIGRSIAVVTTIMLSRGLGADILGFYVLGLGILNITTIFSRLGLTTGSLRFISMYHGKGDEEKIKGIIFQSLSLSFGVGLVLALIIFLSADFISWTFFKNSELVPVIKLFSLSIPFFSALRVAAVVPRGFKIMKYSVYTDNFFSPLFNLLLVLVFLTGGLTLEMAVYAKVISIVLGTFLAIYYISKVFPELLNRNVRPSFNISTLLKSSIPLMGVNVLQFLITWVDVLMIGYFLLPYDVGIYRSAAQVTLILTFIRIAFNAILAPLVADLYYKKDMAGLDHIFKITTKWVFYLTIPLFIILLFSGVEILTLFGEEFTTGVNVLIVLAFARLIQNLTGGLGFALIMSGREKLEFINTFLISGSNIIFNLILIPRYGIIGAAIATGFSIILINLIRLVQVKKKLGIFPYDMRFVKGLIGPVLSIGVLFITKPFMDEFDYILSILLVSFLTMTITTLTLVSLKLDKEDKIILKAIKLKINKIVENSF